MKVSVKDNVTGEDLQALLQRNAVLESHIAECGSVVSKALSSNQLPTFLYLLPPHFH